MKFSFDIIMYIIADAAGTLFAELLEYTLQVFQPVGLGSEMAEMVIAFFGLLPA